MSKSLEFCKTRASNPNISCYANRDWSEARELDISNILDTMLEAKRQYVLTWKTDDETDVKYNVFITVNPNADFDYFTSESYLSDGTTLFFGESLQRLLKKVLFLQTYNKNLGTPVNGCNIHWTIGNYVYLNEFDGDWISEDKKWMDMRTTILLPLKIEYK